MGKTRYDNVRIGMTARLDTMQAAVLDAKMDIFDDELAARQKVADGYQARLGNSVETPRLDAGATSSWAQYTVKLPVGTDRDKLADALRQKNVPSAVYYPIPMHEQPPYQRFPVAQSGLGVTADLCSRVLALPMHPYLDDDMLDQIANALKDSLHAI
jgi:dTDP-4-amino-4,6-dideoxygalactose transaminase